MKEMTTSKSGDEDVCQNTKGRMLHTNLLLWCKMFDQWLCVMYSGLASTVVKPEGR